MQLKLFKSKCKLCPHECELNLGEVGKCLIRRGSFNELGSIASNFEISTISLEPLNKKPITRFPNCQVRADEKTLSLGGYGCSQNCSYCQNFKVSQKKPDKIKSLLGSEIVELAKEKGVNIVCFTFNEPTLYYPQITELHDQLKKNGIFLMLKTNAYLNNKYWKDVCAHTSGMNIDFKGSYQRHLDMIGIKEGTYDTILENIAIAARSNAHLEISVPVFEDYSIEDIQPLIDTLNRNNILVPIHLLRVFPVNRLKGKPTQKDKIDETKEWICNGINFAIPRHTESFIEIHNVYGK